jgi:hypothetical protein
LSESGCAREENGWWFEERGWWLGERGWWLGERGWWLEERGSAFADGDDADMPSCWEDEKCRSTFDPVGASNMESGDHFRSRAVWFSSRRDACVHCVWWLRE